jgi:hypothetical protein
MPVQPHHIHIRWRKDYAARYRRRATDSSLDRWFKSMQWDRRLVITANEYEEMMVRLDKQLPPDDSIFDVPVSECFQKTTKGMIPHQLCTLDSEEARSLFGTGNLSQEIGIPTDSDENSESSCSRTGQTLPMLSGNPFNDMVATLEVLMGHLKGNHALMTELTTGFFGLASEIQKKCRDETNTNLEGEFVSLCPETDQRKRPRRLKAAHEPDRKRKHRRRCGLSVEQSLIGKQHT